MTAAAAPSNKRLYVVERRRDNYPIFVRASHILHAHDEGEKWFEESFRVREANVFEQALAPRHEIVEAA